ncbi:MAG: polyprenyl synthetase family protein [Bacteroidia bacterium]
MDLKTLQKKLPEWALFEERYHAYLRQKVYPDHWLLAKILGYILRRGGKKLRPFLVLQVARTCGAVTEKTYVGAILVELLHNATLAHDDVVDQSDYRRGFFSVRGLWGDKAAVLVGDYLLGKGLSIALEEGATDVLGILSRAVQAMSQAELLQLQKARLQSWDERLYFKILGGKTAALFAAAAEIGALSAQAPKEWQKAAYELGYALGIAFQLRDDVLDWYPHNGKATDLDRKNASYTLPLLIAGRQAHLRSSLKKMPYKVLFTFLSEKGIFQQVENEIHSWTQKALAALAVFPDSPDKENLRQLISLAANRTV